MDQQELHRQAIKNRYNFDGWSRATHQSEPSLPRPFLPDHEALPGYRFKERGAMPRARGTFIDYVEATDDGQIVAALAIQTLPSKAAARERLLDILLECMNPSVPSLSQAGIQAGDVGFGGGPKGEDLLFFLRGNVVVRLWHVGKSRRSLEPLARAIDAQIVQILQNLP
jgi:hypothetical protein